MANTSTKLNLLKEIHKEEEALYAERNQKYGDSFSKTFEKRSYVAALIRMEDKLSRADYLLSHGLEGSDGESLIDTLKDLSNYANMTIMELMSNTQETPQEPEPEAPKKKKSKKKKSKAENTPKDEAPQKESKEEGPLDNLTKKQLVDVLSELGVTASKKSSRTELMDQISKLPKAQVAVAVTSLTTDKETPEAEADGEA